MPRQVHRLLHLVEADHPAMPPAEGDRPVISPERGGDLSALACASMLDASEACAHAVVVLGPPPAWRRAHRLGVAPCARVPVPFGTPHATANALRRVVSRCAVRFEACIAWSGFAARVARLTGFGPGRTDLAPLLEADPHRPDPEASRLELFRGGRSRREPGLLTLADVALSASLSPAALPVEAPLPRQGRALRIGLLADPAASASGTLAWRSALLAAAAGGPVELCLPAGCAGVRRMERAPRIEPFRIRIDPRPLPQRLVGVDVMLAVTGTWPEAHASAGLVAYALSMGVPVVADWRRLADGHPALHEDAPGLHLVEAPVPMDMARALLEAVDRRALAGASA